MAAEQDVVAASEEIGMATANLFPNIQLTGSAGIQSEDFSDLLNPDGEYWIVNLDIVMPLFNAGARRAAVTAAEHRYNETRLAWEQAFLQALREVSDALVLFRRSGEQLEAELALEQASQGYLDLAFKRYRNGVLAYIDVLDAQRSLYAAQIAVSQAREARLTALVSLYRALGGGWTPAAAEPSR
jgi:outer membrane protein TolC